MQATQRKLQLVVRKSLGRVLDAFFVINASLGYPYSKSDPRPRFRLHLLPNVQSQVFLDNGSGADPFHLSFAVVLPLSQRSLPSCEPTPPWPPLNHLQLPCLASAGHSLPASGRSAPIFGPVTVYGWVPSVTGPLHEHRPCRRP